MKVVCDTNVLISGTLFGGHSREILVLASQGILTNFISEDILSEVKEVLLRPKFKLTPQQVTAVITLFRDTFDLVLPTQKHTVVLSDPDDDVILDAAAEAKVDFIVSGDRHLQMLQEWEGISIIAPATLIKSLARP